MDEGTGTSAADLSSNHTSLTTAGGATWSTGKVGPYALSFDGSNDTASASVNLSGTNVVSIAFWMKWDHYANDDSLALEFSSGTYGINSVTTGFMVDPNSSQSGGGSFEVGLKGDGAYGDRFVLNVSGSVISSTTICNQVGFTGRYIDVESGLNYFRIRYYDAKLGRFLSRDPWMGSLWADNDDYISAEPMAGDGYQDGTSLYSAYFVPNITDPFGMECDWEAALTKKLAKIGLSVVAKIAGDKAIKMAEKAIAGALGGPVGEAAAQTMNLIDAIGGIIDVVEAREILGNIASWSKTLSDKLRNLNLGDCIDEKPECCELVKNAVDRALNEVEKGLVMRRGLAKAAEAMGGTLGGLGPELLKCCGLCMKHRGAPKPHSPKGGGSESSREKHEGPRSGGSQQAGDVRRPY